ncbi:MAG TPA: AMP-binding protein [Streptosporangiaceae bacterium]|nr:AMP-binding protein [Streptosporangiaceae bacterium]
MSELTTSYWPADASQPVLETTVGGVLRTAAATASDQLAMVGGVPNPADRKRWTYAELLAEAEQAARALTARFAPGERVAAWAPNLPEWVILEYAAALAGLVLVTVNPALRPAELAYVLRQSGAAGIFLVAEYRSPMAKFLEEVRADLPALREAIFFTEWAEFLATAPSAGAAILPEVHPDDIAQIQYTSGTTGFPKGAELHHRGLTNNARFYAQRIGLQSGEVYVNPMPLFHTAGCAMGVLGTCQSLAVHIPVLAFDPALMLELLETERSDAFLGVPTMMIALLEHPDLGKRDLSSLRVAVSGGSPVPAGLVRRVEERLGVPFSIVFGTTECSPLLTQVRPDAPMDRRAETLGTPLPQTEVKVADLVTGRPVPRGEVGELRARGYLVMRGYHDAPEATAQAIDTDGWYHTGDLGSMDAEGYLRIEGRVKDMIIRGGENIYPREIEDVLFAHPAVAEVAVVGVPDEKWGEVVAAYIRLAPGQSEPSPDELRAYCRDRLAAFKTPLHWLFVEDFPLTPSGKIQKFKLRENFAEPTQFEVPAETAHS